MIELLLDVITALGGAAFWVGAALGVAEVAGMLAFWRWAFRLGWRTGYAPQVRIERPPTPGQQGTTHFVAFKVMGDGTCVFRRKVGFLQTALEWKGILHWRGDHPEVTALQPFGPTLAALGLVVAWSAYGVNLAIRGEYLVGAILVVVVAVATALSAKETVRVGRIRFNRYVEELAQVLGHQGAAA